MATKSIYKSRMPFKGVFGFFCGEHMAITVPETEPLEFYSRLQCGGFQEKDAQLLVILSIVLNLILSFNPLCL